MGSTETTVFLADALQTVHHSPKAADYGEEMSIFPSDDVGVVDLRESDRSDGVQRRRQRQTTPPPPEGPNGLGGDPRVLVPIFLFVVALLLIGLAWSSRGDDEVETETAVATDSELVDDVRNAELRAGFDGLIIQDIDGVLTIQGVAANAIDVAAIGAVARSVDGTQRVDNQVTVEGGSIDSQFPVSELPLTNGGIDLAAQLNSLGRITFEPGSSDLTNEGTVVVDNVARLLEQSPGVRIEIHGHTDSDGDEAANQVLSQQRAQAVVSSLAQRGINSGRLTAVGFGELNPIAPNITADGRATNRRIEFILPQ